MMRNTINILRYSNTSGGDSGNNKGVGNGSGKSGSGKSVNSTSKMDRKEKVQNFSNDGPFRKGMHKVKIIILNYHRA